MKVIHKVLKGNPHAIKLIEDIARVARTWDDLIDKDHDVTDIQVNKAFWTALIEIPSNPFYAEHQFQLIPLFRDYINCWLDANEVEKKDTLHKKQIAFILRDMIANIAIQCAYLIGGYSWMRAISPLIRGIQFEEPFGEYMGGT